MDAGWQFLLLASEACSLDISFDPKSGKMSAEESIEKIFVAEQIRLGAVLDGADKELPRTLRVVGTKTFTSWKSLGMGAKWDEYMDDVFENAKKKSAEFVDNVNSV